jgi:hypothetical protein
LRHPACRNDVITNFNLPPVPLARFLRRMEEGYKANPYHNATHAADVLQTLNAIIFRGGLAPGYVDPLHLMAAYVAAVSVGPGCARRGAAVCCGGKWIRMDMSGGLQAPAPAHRQGLWAWLGVAGRGWAWWLRSTGWNPQSPLTCTLSVPSAGRTPRLPVFTCACFSRHDPMIISLRMNLDLVFPSKLS